MDPTITIHQDTINDLMAVAQITRRDHRDVLAEAVDIVRRACIPKTPQPRKPAKPADKR